jgi:hypothetical protein
MRMVDPPDPDVTDEQSAADWAQVALRAARVRWSVDATAPVDRESPFSLGSPSTGDDGQLFGA